MTSTTFKQLAVNDRFVFILPEGSSQICIKTGPTTYLIEIGGIPGRVGAGDNPVRRV